MRLHTMYWRPFMLGSQRASRHQTSWQPGRCWTSSGSTLMKVMAFRHVTNSTTRDPTVPPGLPATANHPLRKEARVSENGSARVYAGPVEAGDQPVHDRMATGRKYDRHGRGGSLGRERCIDVRNNDCPRQADQFSDQTRQALELVVSVTVFDRLLPFDEAGASFRPCRNAVVRCWKGERGHAAAPPGSVAKNFRR